MLFRLTMLLMVVATFQLSFLGIYLFWEGLKKRSGHFYLGLFFFLLALNLMDLLLKIQGYQSFYTSFAFLDDAFILAFGPLIYFYTNSIIIPDVLWKPGWWWHLLPFIVVSIFLTVALITQSTSEQLELLQNIEDYQIPNGVKVAVIAAQLHPLIYSILSFRLLGQYRVNIRQQYSNTERADLNWLGFILKFISILFIVALIHGIVPAIFGTAYLGFTLLVFAIFLLYFIIRILLRSMRNSEVLQLSVHKKYQGSNLIEGQRILLKKQLEQLIGSQKPFLDPDLTLDQLSAAIDFVTSDQSKLQPHFFRVD